MTYTNNALHSEILLPGRKRSKDDIATIHDDNFHRKAGRDIDKYGEIR